VGKYSILCCDTQNSSASAGDSKAVEYVVIRIVEVPLNHSGISYKGRTRVDVQT
jgi:hypothetical protein